MKKLLLLLSLISFNAFATDRGVPCNSNSCSVKIVAKDGSGVDSTVATFNSTSTSIGTATISSTGQVAVSRLNGTTCASLADGSDVSNCFYVRQAVNYTLNTFIGGIAGQILTLCNNSTTTTVINNAAGANNFLSGTGANITLAGNDCVMMIRDGSGFWRIISIVQ